MHNNHISVAEFFPEIHIYKCLVKLFMFQSTSVRQKKAWCFSATRITSFAYESHFTCFFNVMQYMEILYLLLSSTYTPTTSFHFDLLSKLISQLWPSNHNFSFSANTLIVDTSCEQNSPKLLLQKFSSPLPEVLLTNEI